MIHSFLEHPVFQVRSARGLPPPPPMQKVSVPNGTFQVPTAFETHPNT